MWECKLRIFFLELFFLYIIKIIFFFFIVLTFDMNFFAFFLVTSDNHSFTMEITEETIITDSRKKKTLWYSMGEAMMVFFNH